MTTARGAVNTSLFLIVPFLAPVVLGTGRTDQPPAPGAGAGLWRGRSPCRRLLGATLAGALGAAAMA